ncbi:DUF4163 domain-containing protein [Sphingobium sp. HBC34]|uniref:DUF4163 domain-containing protein n=1 Tax=Sphingobium cyanobacteriorum TaxID=3063954 RepID=A0ABT8ZKC5_9SPHN|nr:DUF4163 domain-containing protein [Sphingobium sp. HBC34]MDO7834973.1 DUF4163 domain-containing protein [Sphingobium sp. HBC34]
MQGRGLEWAAAALLLAACSPSPDQPGSNAAANAAASRYAEKMAGAPQPPPPAKPFAEADKGAFLEYAYAYPAQAAAIPALVEKFDKARTTLKADALRMAREDSAAAKESGFPFRPHSLETRWTVAADTPRFLSLQSDTYVYTGGAHGMTGYDGLIWDKARSRETSVKALMTAPAAFATAIRDRFCKELDRQRAEKRGAPVVPGDDDFTQCIDPLEQLIVPTSKDGRLIDGMTVVIGPYSAGPYAEGSYEVALPMDAAMRKAIKTEYQDGFVK